MRDDIISYLGVLLWNFIIYFFFINGWVLPGVIVNTFIMLLYVGVYSRVNMKVFDFMEEVQKHMKEEKK